MSSPNDPNDAPDARTSSAERPRVDVLQMAAGALAATTAAVIGSRLGVNGTIIGAAVGSIVGTVGSATYAHYLSRTATRVRTVVVRTPGTRPSRPTDVTTALDVVPGDDRSRPDYGETTASGDPPRADAAAQGSPTPEEVYRAEPGEAAPARAAGGDGTGPPSRPESATPDASSRRGAWRWVVLAVAATFVVSLAALTVFELLAGRSVSSLTGGDPDRGSTTIGEVLRPAPATLPSETPLPRPTDTATVTSTPSPTTTTTTTTSPSPTPTSPSPTPSTPTPSPTPTTATTSAATP